MKIQLTGVFRLITPEGAEVSLPGKQGPALLAILATSRHCERSRDFLKAMLWPRSPEPQSSANLRSLLSALRKRLGPKAHILVAERTRIRLEGVEVDGETDLRHEFYEDAPNLGESFEDWLTQERASTRNAVAPVPQTGAGAATARRRCIAIYPPHTLAEDRRSLAIAGCVTEQLIRHLRSLEAVDVFDFSACEPSGMAAELAAAGVVPELAVSILPVCGDTFDRIGVRAFSPVTQKVYWNAAITADRSSGTPFRPDQLDMFAGQAVDAIGDVILRAA